MSPLAPKDRIIFPLDLPTKDKALEFVRLLKDSVGVFKVGLELFIAEGPAIIRSIKEIAPESKIFLDLKLHDITETVRRALKSVTMLGVDFVTMHCDNKAMLSAAEEATAAGCKVLGVTVLTNLSQDDLKEIGITEELQDPKDLVLHRAGLAKEAGLSGIVCSGQEVGKITEKFGQDLITVTPGIRPLEKTSAIKKDDQKRVVTPFDAIKDGADYIVVGRPIRDAEDPKAASANIAEEIKRALDENPRS
ncbi:MAG: orotidine-5'-phosphate decarboxylase [Deltaproteobacteria bacterium]|nr:orotidine-5'-phosphate decarboxylase [Deltaproteobacteria bacterium]